MSLEADQRRRLGDFLRSRRESMTPDMTDVSSSVRRRRTPGLRREEIADLCGISPTWYTWAEQGRDIAMSSEALGRIANALRLSHAERHYLFELARRRDPALPDPAQDRRIPAELSAAIGSMPTPAYLLDRLWDVTFFNDAARDLFAPWIGEDEPNLLRFTFLHAQARDLIVDWEERAARIIAEFRADTAHDPGNPEMRGLIDELRQKSSLFSKLWSSHDVLEREGGLRLFRRKETGLLAYRQVTLFPATLPGWKLVILVPEEEVS